MIEDPGSNPGRGKIFQQSWNILKAKPLGRDPSDLHSVTLPLRHTYLVPVYKKITLPLRVDFPGKGKGLAGILKLVTCCI